MTPLEKEILDEIYTGVEYSDYMGGGDFARSCAFCNVMLDLHQEHKDWCLTAKLRKERDD